MINGKTGGHKTRNDEGGEGLPFVGKQFVDDEKVRIDETEAVGGGFEGNKRSQKRQNLVATIKGRTNSVRRTVESQRRTLRSRVRCASLLAAFFGEPRGGRWRRRESELLSRPVRSRMTIQERAA